MTRTGETDPTSDAAALAAWLESQGAGEAAARARRLADSLGDWERDVRARAGEVLAVHHDIRNALTGVLGNAQLVLMGPAAEVPGVRRRMESLVREAERIKELAERLQRARMELLPDAGPRSAAGEEAA